MHLSMYALVNHLARGCCTVEFVPCKRGKANLVWIATFIRTRRPVHALPPRLHWPSGPDEQLHRQQSACPHNDYQHVENTARCSKQKLNAATSKFTSFILAVTCFADMRDHVHLTKLGCTEESLRNMARCARQKANHHPVKCQPNHPGEVGAGSRRREDS